jgi:HK97 family phage prohead protease
MQLKYLNLAGEVKTGSKPGSFTGRASVYGVVDAQGDTVMPGAFSKTLAEKGSEIVVLSQHDPSNAIGKASLQDSPEALLVEGQLELELPSARDEYVRLKSGLVTGISIGFVTRDARFEQGVRQLLDLDLWEVSLVTFPACEPARVTDVKHRDGREIETAFALQLIAAHLDVLVRQAKREALASDLAHSIQLAERRLKNLERQLKEGR